MPLHPRFSPAGQRLAQPIDAGAPAATAAPPHRIGLPPVQGAIVRLLLTAEGVTADALLIFADAADEAAQYETDPAPAAAWQRLASLLRDLAPHYPAARLRR